MDKFFEIGKIYKFKPGWRPQDTRFKLINIDNKNAHFKEMDESGDIQKVDFETSIDALEKTDE